MTQIRFPLVPTISDLTFEQSACNTDQEKIIIIIKKTMGNKSKTDSKLPTEKAGKPNMSKKKKKSHSSTSCGPKRNRFRSAKQTATAVGYNRPLGRCLRSAGLRGSCRIHTHTRARTGALGHSRPDWHLYTVCTHTPGPPAGGRAGRPRSSYLYTCTRGRTGPGEAAPRGS